MLHSQSAISPVFVDLLGIILNESCWKEKSNQTALVFLLSVASPLPLTRRCTSPRTCHSS